MAKNFSFRKNIILGTNITSGILTTKHELISGYIHTKRDKFENATFLIRIGLSSTLKRRFQCPKTELFENALQSG